VLSGALVEGQGVQTALDGSRRGGFGMRDGDTRVHSTEIKKDLANVCPPAWHMMWYHTVV